MAGMGQLTGKGALVTGGSRGIGRAIVKRLAADGATVVFSFLHSEAAAEQVVAEVAGDGGKAFAVRADQGSLDDLNRLFAETGKYLGDSLDIVVCNAADGLPVAFEDVTEDAYDRYMAVNAKGPFFIIQYAGRKLRDGGRIITISTLNTRMHAPGGALYTGGKGAVENFTKVAALTFGGRGITANIVSPGATDTDMLRGANPGSTFAETIALTSLGRLGQPEDIASAVAMLAGPDSAWITGQNIPVDGGILP
jgi:3-oxoacyl-[acyl-carrier protein] reductase